MEVFVARQPLFNRMEEVYGYELLYRHNNMNSFPNINGDQATTEVLINSFFNIGIDKLSDGKPCFINFTENLLELRLPTYFQPRNIVIEILESVIPSQKIIDICIELKQLGYKLALDDFIFDKSNLYSQSLLLLADMIKVDFQQTTKETRSDLETLARKNNIELVAEKLETKEEYEQAKNKGYHYFQGYYFSRPLIMSTHDVPIYIHTYYKILELLNDEDPDINRISKLIEQDISLSYKLLKLINTLGYGMKQKVTSIKNAIIYIGLIELQKWIYVLTVRENEWKNGISFEVMLNCLIRSKMCESVAKLIPGRQEYGSFFLTGMFSLMDTIMNRDMATILSDLPLDETIVQALSGEKNIQRDVLQLVIAAETADWTGIGLGCKELNIQEKELFKEYAESISWAKKLLDEDYL
ncbi:EAL and HDOD domain-containing protein [Niallia sp. Sow4_A1]|jgi:c-di-GMP-related signal transduction protein|uniref:EAL domain-containing protein n=1 Tax=Niallia hominis TaxID=3133173 RepID=A0ABV1F6F4_9BACI|nr:MULTISPECIES: EAL domain-containing protein [Bacillaceae]MCM3364529.1 EAL domain-containing protein [Niallia sp. MER TA 168]